MKRKLIFSAALVVGVFALASCVQNSPAPWVPAGCINSDAEGAPDFYFSGQPNKLDNAWAFLAEGATELSDDGTCTGDPAFYGTIVVAPNAAGAITVCDNLGITGLEAPANLSANGYALPTNAWTCLDQT